MVDVMIILAWTVLGLLLAVVVAGMACGVSNSILTELGRPKPRLARYEGLAGKAVSGALFAGMLLCGVGLAVYAK